MTLTEWQCPFLKRTSGILLSSLRCSKKNIIASLHWIKQKSADTIICKFDTHKWHKGISELKVWSYEPWFSIQLEYNKLKCLVSYDEVMSEPSFKTNKDIFEIHISVWKQTKLRT